MNLMCPAVPDVVQIRRTVLVLLLNIILAFYFPVQTIRGQKLPDLSEFQNCLTESEGAVIRMDTTMKVIYLVSSADEFGEGAEKMLDILASKKVKASFFLTGNFLRNPAFAGVTARM